MPDADEKKSWWQTLPGIATGTAALLTALTGFLLALNQVGFIGSSKPSGANLTRPLAGESRPAQAEAALGEGAPQTTPASAAGTSRSVPKVELAGPREISFKDYQYAFLAIEARPRTPALFELHLKIRATSNTRYGMNFWDASFRLLVDGVPTAPDSGLNVVVEGNSARDGDITFPVPANARSLELRILGGDPPTDLPLTLRH
ncbi:MAG TPA: hypothetical protein VI356_18800 [Myxococcales bacterium]